MKAITTIITLTPRATPMMASMEKKEIFLWEGNNCFHAKYSGQGILMTGS